MTSKTLRFESQNRKKSRRIATKTLENAMMEVLEEYELEALRVHQQEFLQKPLGDRLNIASNMRDASQKNNSNKDVSIMDVTPASIEKFFDEHHIDLLIHGHTHRPNTHQDDTGTRIVLGDWHKTGWCLMLDEKQQELKEFTL